MSLRPRGERMYKVLFTILFISQSLFAGYSPNTPIALFSSNAERDSFFFYSLAPEIQPQGPIIDFANPTEENKQKYVQNLFGYIVKIASDHYKKTEGYLSSKYFGVGDFKFYPYVEGSDENYSFYAFIITALSIFQHESRITHFRKVPASYCSQKKNDLTYSKSKNTYMGRYSHQVQESTFRNPYKTLTPNCEDLSDQETVNQLITSSNHDDFGIGQLNIYYHPLVVSEDYAFNVYNNIDYAVDYMLEGFNRVRNIIEYIKIENTHNGKFKHCDFWSHPFSGGRLLDKPFYNLVRATWAGTYNHGAPSDAEKVCRFAQSNNHDNGFKQSLDSIVINENSFYHRYLPENSIERKALDEIVFNFKNIFKSGKQKETNLFLNILANNSYRKAHPSIANHPEDSLESNYESSHFLITQNYANFRMIKPETDETKVCGQVQQIASTQDTSLKVVGSYTNYKNKEFNGDTWYAVVFPKYAPFVSYNEDPDCLDESKNLYTEDGSKIFMIHSSLLIPIETKVKYKGVLSKKITTMNIYKHHSYNSGIVDIIIQKRNNNNDHIEVEILNIIDRNNNPQWYYIKTSTYNFGWIPAKYVEEVVDL